MIGFKYGCGFHSALNTCLFLGFAPTFFHKLPEAEQN